MPTRTHAETPSGWITLNRCGTAACECFRFSTITIELILNVDSLCQRSFMKSLTELNMRHVIRFSAVCLIALSCLVYSGCGETETPAPSTPTTSSGSGESEMSDGSGTKNESASDGSGTKTD